MNGLLRFTGYVVPAVAGAVHAADALSFIRRRPAGTDYWAVEDSQDRQADYALGERLGAEYLEFIGASPTNINGALLGQIVGAMARDIDEAGNLPATAAGFLRTVNEHAMSAAIIMAWPREEERHAGR